MKRYVCIHGHFYQPPRENPWLEVVEEQDSARPYHDWNHRITAECYAPNANARILDAEDYIVNIVNNYGRISFNMGPTLLSWMESEEPETYRAIIEADKGSARRFGGHGSAIAQVYNHMILPLANARDRKTQVRWGVRDFEHRFGRKPAGMWLAETAADVASLDALAEEGIQFTILAPRQCKRVRLEGGEWKEVGGAVDPRRPYWVNLPGGRRIAVFFYDGPISQGIAFERLLSRGETLAERLISAFDDQTAPQLVHVATDGETYGHHHRYGEMALAYALPHIERNGLARVTNYAEYLELHPPTTEAEIVENSSWSCEHGVERWRADCGCRADDARGWTQAWRRPLRETLDWLRDELATIFETRYPLADPWKARDDYVDLILDRSIESCDRFFSTHLDKDGTPPTKEKMRAALTLLEMQRHAMLMYTSCGWFFDELSGLETTQIIRYAARAIQLAQVHAPGLEADFLSRLSAAKSNVAELGDGAKVYADMVKPAMVELPRLVAHYAVSSIFDHYDKKTELYAHDFEELDRHFSRSGKRRLAIGKVYCSSRITRENATLSYAVLHLGEQALTGGVRAFRGDDEYAAMRAEVTEAFANGDLPALMRLLGSYFLDMTYSLRSLLGDQQRRIASSLLAAAIDNVTDVSMRLHRDHAGVIRYVAGLGLPLPQMVHSAAGFVLNGNLRRALGEETPEVSVIAELIQEARALRVELDSDDLAAVLEASLVRLAVDFSKEPRSVAKLEALSKAARCIEAVPFELHLFRVQTAAFAVARDARRVILAESQTGGAKGSAALRWLEKFSELALRLRVRI